MEQVAGSLTNMQLELLKVFSYQLPEEELSEMKQVLVEFFAKRLEKRASKIWNDKKYTQDDMEKWLTDDTQ